MSEQNGKQEPALEIPVERIIPHLQQQISSLSMERAALAARCEMLIEELKVAYAERESLKASIDAVGGAQPTSKETASK